MHGESAEINVSPDDASRNGLEFAHRLAAASSPPSPADLLAALATAFAADGAGVAALAGGPPVSRRSSLVPPARWPWDAEPNLRGRLRGERAAWTLAHPDGGSFLVVAMPGLARGWLVWLESRQRTAWNAAENAAFVLAASAVARAFDDQTHAGDQLERLEQQQKLEHAAAAISRVAHDYGNVLTSILGFNELALALPMPPDGALRRYLTEVHQGAESGADLTQQLRLFARRQAAAPRPCPLEPVLSEERASLQAADGLQAIVQLALPPDLPPVAIDGDHLRLIVRALLDNAVEAAKRPGNVAVKARVVTIAAEECLDYYGNVRPGPHVELRITDDGDGLTPEIQRRLFAEPFFSTNARRRGYGLFAAYGVLHAHQGGLRLTNAPDGGALARVVLPVAIVPDTLAIAPSRLERQAGDKVLVVDDEPLVLRFVAGALEKAGYRVHTANSAAEAVAAHAVDHGEPFCLLLSDVIMPHESGAELAKRLLANDGDLRVLFMTGHAAGVDVPKEIAGRACELLQKPFRSEELLRAVRATLERGRPRAASVGSPSR